MDAYEKQLLAKIDKLAAEADPLPKGDPRKDQLVQQIEALNIAVIQHDQK